MTQYDKAEPHSGCLNDEGPEVTPECECHWSQLAALQRHFDGFELLLSLVVLNFTVGNGGYEADSFDLLLLVLARCCSRELTLVRQRL
jgi:hypothetical protein